MWMEMSQNAWNSELYKNLAQLKKSALDNIMFYVYVDFWYVRISETREGAYKFNIVFESRKTYRRIE